MYKKYKLKRENELNELILENDSYAFNELGERFFQKEDFENAIKYFKKAEKLGNPMGTNNIGYYFLVIEENLEEAEKYFIKAIENKNFEAYDNLINLYKEMNNKEQLKTILEEIKNSDEDIPEEVVKKTNIEIIKLAIPRIISFVVIILIIKFIFFK